MKAIGYGILTWLAMSFIISMLVGSETLEKHSDGIFFIAFLIAIAVTLITL